MSSGKGSWVGANFISGQFIYEYLYDMVSFVSLCNLIPLEIWIINAQKATICSFMLCDRFNLNIHAFFKFFYWRIIVLQNFVVFCQTSTWISHRYTYIPSLLKLPPISLPTSRLIQSPCLSFLSHTANSRWLSILHMVM